METTEKFQRGKILLLCGAMFVVGWLANSLHAQMRQQLTAADNLAIAGREIADRLLVELKNYPAAMNEGLILPLLPPKVRDFRLTSLAEAKSPTWIFSFYITDAPTTVDVKSPREIEALPIAADEKQKMQARAQAYRWEYVQRVVAKP